MKAYVGKLLRVNLTKHKAIEVPLREDYARDYIGGTGLGVRLAYDEVTPETDPLSPEAKIFFMTGPITGTPMGTTGRYQVIFKSPLTGILCDSSSSGFWGVELKNAGYDGLIIEGASDAPVYVYINDGKVEFRDARKHWGKDAISVQEDLRAEVGNPKARVAAIGQAGENKVLFSCIVNDDGRVPGRGGNGAVMGSKNLKAIVVRGTGKVELADPEGFKKIAMALNKKNATEPSLANLRKYGTSTVLDARWPISDIPVKNWSVGSSEAACTPLGGEKQYELSSSSHASCYRCPISCSSMIIVKDGPYKMEGTRAEYESLAALGTMCMIDDIKAVCFSNNLCNRYGLDTISCGSTIAFSMECYEKGLLSKDNLDGIDLTWGNKDGVHKLIHKIAKQEGAGKLLGLGTLRMAQKLGGDSMDFAVQVKGLDFPMHDPRARFAWATTYATSPRGACHLHGMTDVYEESEDPIPEWGFTGKYTRLSNNGKGKMARFAQDWAHLLDSLVMCYFAGFVLKPSDFCNLLNTSTGSTLKPEDLLVIAHRINTLHRAYNCRCGIGRKDDVLPKRALSPLAEGGSAGEVPDLETQLKEYYKLRRWEPDGKPNRDLLVELGLESVAKDLYA